MSFFGKIKGSIQKRIVNWFAPGFVKNMIDKAMAAFSVMILAWVEIEHHIVEKFVSALGEFLIAVIEIILAGLF